MASPEAKHLMRRENARLATRRNGPVGWDEEPQ
jgi:hypothetical protein